MFRNWKKAAALGLAVLLGCAVPMSTMLAAENEPGSVSGNDEFYEDENAPDDGNASGEEGAPDDGNASGEEGAPDDGNVSGEESAPDDGNASGEESTPDDGNASGEESTPDDGNVSGEESTPNDGNVSGEEGAPDDENVPDGENTEDMPDDGIPTAPGEEQDAETKGVEPKEPVLDDDVTSAPEIVITRDGKNSTCSLGGEIDFEYVNHWGPQVEVSVNQNDEDVSVFWFKDKVTDMEAEAKAEEQMDQLDWTQRKSPSESILLSQDGKYVVYVKVTAGGQNYYARSNGIVVDTKMPVIKGVEEGKTYPEGTLFQVEDANLDCVLVNEQPAVSENGNYKVAANGTSCLIRAKDKAGNETTCSITVLGTEPPEPDTPEDSHVISESGVYDLKAGEKYHLAEGKWYLEGDKSVYQGGSDFYVTADGSYRFSR